MNRQSCRSGKIDCVVYFMIDQNGIRLKNIYYMLSYAYQVLRQSCYQKMQTEKFEHIHDLLAAILGKGVAQQLKQGLYREYISKSDCLTVMRGKLNLTETMQNFMQHKQMLACEYDELSENNRLNQIVKTAIKVLIKQETVQKQWKAMLKKELLFFDQIDEIAPSAVDWERLYFQKNNQNYQMLMNLCNLILEGMIFTTEQGTVKMTSFLDEQRMSRLYEKFILGYYQVHHPKLQANAEQIRWDLENGRVDFLPVMQTDITLRQGEKVLIIDAKYYKEVMQTRFEGKKIRSEHLYQIFAYVKNLDREHTGKVGGMLLYAQTGETVQPEEYFSIGGNPIWVRTLNLNLPFLEISKQLERIVQEFFGE